MRTDTGMIMNNSDAANATTTTLVGNFQYNGNTCTGTPLISTYFYADPKQGCTQFSGGGYIKSNCTSSPQVVAVSASST